MGLLFDTHLHTKRHSGCSELDEHRLIARAVKAGLDGVIITEHHYQWPEEELQALRDAADAPGFVLLSGFEYTSRQGDILIYGLDASFARAFPPREEPGAIVERVHALGGVCVAAHPTRAGLGFGMEIAQMPFDGLETQSVNLQAHEQRLALSVAGKLGMLPTAASDAHRLADVGAYAMILDGPVRNMSDFCDCLRARQCRPASVPAQGRVRQ
jgi:predicted metal-dependent phosphoesterase TrpH